MTWQLAALAAAYIARNACPRPPGMALPLCSN